MSNDLMDCFVSREFIVSMEVVFIIFRYRASFSEGDIPIFPAVTFARVFS
jgi:hypothetical protein